MRFAGEAWQAQKDKYGRVTLIPRVFRVGGASGSRARILDTKDLHHPLHCDRWGLVMIEALHAAAVFMVSNLTRRDPRSPHRHPWKWCLFVISDIIISRIPVPTTKSGAVIILVNRLGDAIVSRSLVLAIQSKIKASEQFLVLGDYSWQVLRDNLYLQIPTKFIDEERF
jgi:hypothetical protein